MPQRFYFDLTDGFTTIRDEEGVEADDLQVALTYAEKAIQEMRLDGELTRLDADWQFEIRIHDGAVLATLSIS